MIVSCQISLKTPDPLCQTNAQKCYKPTGCQDIEFAEPFVSCQVILSSKLWHLHKWMKNLQNINYSSSYTTIIIYELIRLWNMSDQGKQQNNGPQGSHFQQPFVLWFVFVVLLGPEKSVGSGKELVHPTDSSWIREQDFAFFFFSSLPFYFVLISLLCGLPNLNIMPPQSSACFLKFFLLFPP